jgi:hypothetical protein
MQSRKDVEWGSGAPPSERWASYRAELHERLVAAISPGRVREGVQAPGDIAPTN